MLIISFINVTEVLSRKIDSKIMTVLQNNNKSKVQ